VPALEPVDAWRAVASPAALDAARWSGDDVDVIRIAPDEALGIGATGATLDDDPDAIVEPDSGFSVGLLDMGDVVTLLAHTEWDVPMNGASGTVVQGKIAGVPAKLLIGDPSLLVVQTAYVDELRARLGW